MSTSRKLVVKLDILLRCSPKHRSAARKATSTEVTRETIQSQSHGPPVKQTNASTAEMPANRRTGEHQPTGELSPPVSSSGLQFNLFAFATGYQGKYYLHFVSLAHFVHLHILEQTPGPSCTQSQTMPGPSHTHSNPCPLHTKPRISSL